MQGQLYPQGLGRRLAGLVIGRGTYTAAAEPNPARGKATLQGLGNGIALVGNELRAAQLHARWESRSTSFEKCLSWRRPDRISSPMMISRGRLAVAILISMFFPCYSVLGSMTLCARNCLSASRLK